MHANLNRGEHTSSLPGAKLLHACSVHTQSNEEVEGLVRIRSLLRVVHAYFERDLTLGFGLV